MKPKYRIEPCRLCRMLKMFGRPQAHYCCADRLPDWKVIPKDWTANRRVAEGDI